MPAPAIDWFSIAYLPKNIAPEITAIAIQDPGVRVQALSLPEGGDGAEAPAPLPIPQPQPPSSPSMFNAAMSIRGSARAGAFRSMPQGFSKRFASVLWTTTTQTTTNSVFGLLPRRERIEWKLLKDKLDSKFYAWDTTAMPDGAYT
jgi:hypothetical protein